MRGLRTFLAVLLAIEALNTLLWSARILSVAAAYDAVVLLMVLLRVVVAAGQGMAAWLLAGREPAAVPLARLAFVASAVLLVLEVGFRLSPSSVPPGLRGPLVAAYCLYVLSCMRGLAMLARADRS